MTIGEKIQKFRKKHNYTQEELAGKLNVSRQTISKWENDTTIPDSSNIFELSKLFNTSTDYLLDYDEKVNDKQNTNSFVIDIIVLILGLTGLIIFGILLLIGKVNETSSTITLDTYGIFFFVFILISILGATIIIKRFNEKDKTKKN